MPARDQDQYWRFIKKKRKTSSWTTLGRGEKEGWLSLFYSFSRILRVKKIERKKKARVKQRRKRVLNGNQFATAGEWVRKRKASSDLLHETTTEKRETSTIVIGNLPHSLSAHCCLGSFFFAFFFRCWEETKEEENCMHVHRGCFAALHKRVTHHGCEKMASKASASSKVKRTKHVKQKDKRTHQAMLSLRFYVCIVFRANYAILRVDYSLGRILSQAYYLFVVLTPSFPRNCIDAFDVDPYLFCWKKVFVGFFSLSFF